MIARSGLLIIAFGWLASSQAAPLALLSQSRSPAAASGEAGRIAQEVLRWEGTQTAAIVCDMWDNHSCIAARERVAEMAPAMNRFLNLAREAGVLIVHSPSDTMSHYEGTPQRKRAQEAVHHDLPNPAGWKPLDPSREPALPIDDSGFPCDGPIDGEPVRVWTRQIETLEIALPDAIADNGQEIYNLLRERDIRHVMVMGVHTNMCVLGRPFGIRALVENGFETVLIRDLTDGMIDPSRPPYVDHFRGNDLVIEHIEKYWCPTILSSSLTGQKPFVFGDDRRPRVAAVIHEREYETERTLPAFCEDRLAGERQWHIEYVLGDGENNLPGLEVLKTTDLLLLSVRRQVLPPDQMKRIRDYCQTGKPVAGLRTACHAFLLRNADPPEGWVDWKTFDPDLFGGHYTNHHNNTQPDSPRTVVWALPEQKDHPILAGLSLQPFEVTSSLYKVLPLGDAAEPLLMGRVADRQPEEPVAWTNRSVFGNRVFFTSLGSAEDFKEGNFRKLLENGIVWALGEQGLKKP